MAFSVAVLNLGYLILISATLTRQVQWLRGMLIVGAVAFVAYGALTSNWTMLGWNSVIGVLHGRQLLHLMRARRAVVLSAEEDALRQVLCPELDRFDFYAWWSMGENRVVCDEELTVRDRQQNELFLVLDGVVDVLVDGGVVTRSTNELVGELSYLSRKPASATAMANGSVTIRAWRHTHLDALDQLNPSAAAGLQRLLSGAIAGKVVS